MPCVYLPGPAPAVTIRNTTFGYFHRLVVSPFSYLPFSYSILVIRRSVFRRWPFRHWVFCHLVIRRFASQRSAKQSQQILPQHILPTVKYVTAPIHYLPLRGGFYSILECGCLDALYVPLALHSG